MNIKITGKLMAAYTAMILAVIMLFLPGSDTRKFSFKPEVLATAIVSGEDSIAPATLSEWIIQGKSDLMIIDIRSEEDFSKGAIKKAVNIPLQKLLTKETINSEFNIPKTVVLYSNGNSHAHQTWLVLKSAGVDALVLQGGYNAWVETILNPSKPVAMEDDEVLKYNAAMSVAKFFGSSGEVKESADSETKSAPSNKPAVQPKKKKLAGCG
ncbi:MAG TPA: rhodanese-like domain-containing protein [Spirochaetota bacterium]|nr:rhodanese-like domain-containing protein [Spirochaetota bacterium]HOK92041.1 rhodanese-like domain-containing protein [Spirochaetota bacterium]HPP94609.1 rhodanese-like domain-containing protein [Spirochaetota bacterium]